MTTMDRARVTNDLLLQALQGTNTGRPPIWLMRQAGRYLPEYRALRKNYSFLEMIHTPALATAVTLQPIKRFGFDAAILFSDILVTAEAMGCDVQFIEKRGPVIADPIRTQAAVNALTTQHVAERLESVMQTIRALKSQLTVPLIGFAGAPFTVASYMVEGQSSRSLTTVKQLRYREPAVLTALLDRLTTVTIEYVMAQIESGVDVIQLFDTWANQLSWADFNDFSLPYLQRIVSHIRAHSAVPIILFCKNSGVLWPLLETLAPTAISVDWGCDCYAIRQQLDTSIALQGNIDPFLLYAPPAVIKKTVTHLLDHMGPYPNYIANLGHGIFPDSPLAHVGCLVETVKQWSGG